MVALALLDRLDPSTMSTLFCDPGMFDSSTTWQRAGFDVDKRRDGGKSDIMVAAHPSLPGVLFKKYSKKVSLTDQLENYTRRVTGAQKLRELIDAEYLTKIGVPAKRLCELPPMFARKGQRAHILAVERFVLVDKSTCEQMYRGMDGETLRQLCVVVKRFRGLSSGPRNMPFARDGRIVFIDTERWSHGHKSPPLQRIREYLTEENKRFVDSLFPPP